MKDIHEHQLIFISSFLSGDLASAEFDCSDRIQRSVIVYKLPVIYGQINKSSTAC